MIFKINTFKGGVHPREFKELSDNQAFEIMPVSKEIILPLQQHLGKEAAPVVKKKDRILAGQLVAEAVGFISAPVHSPVTGTVKDIKSVATSIGFPKKSIIITPEESDENKFLEPMDIDSVTPEQIVERVKVAGIVGMDGASFPTYVKLIPQKDKPIDTLIINACECEPYFTRDYRIMMERPMQFISGIKLIIKALKVKKAIIGIEDNKPQAIEILKQHIANEETIKLEVLRTKYPQGAEKMLIHASIKRQFSPGKLPLDFGVVVQNVVTALLVYEAVVEGKPQIEAILTVSGKGIKTPKNLIVKIGTPLKDILDYCGGISDDTVKLVVGGLMMGNTVYDLKTPLMKATSGILFLTQSEVNDTKEQNCVRCGNCVEVCPVNLYPTKLARLSRYTKYKDALNMGIMNCMECGTCQYNCPSNVPLVHWLKLGKSKAKNIQVA